MTPEEEWGQEECEGCGWPLAEANEVHEDIRRCWDRKHLSYEEAQETVWICSACNSNYRLRDDAEELRAVLCRCTNLVLAAIRKREEPPE